jgi:hypothetical protein
VPPAAVPFVSPAHSAAHSSGTDPNAIGTDRGTCTVCGILADVCRPVNLVFLLARMHPAVRNPTVTSAERLAAVQTGKVSRGCVCHCLMVFLDDEKKFRKKDCWRLHSVPPSLRAVRKSGYTGRRPGLSKPVSVRCEQLGASEPARTVLRHQSDRRDWEKPCVGNSTHRISAVAPNCTG